MLKKIWRRLTGADVRFLQWQLLATQNQLNDYTVVLDRTKREKALLKDALEKVTAREKELQRQSDDRGQNLIKWELKNQSLTEQLANLENQIDFLNTQDAKLRNSIGHLLHGMAAVQDLSDSFVKRIDMIPQFFGLGEPLAKDILDEFAKQNKPKEEEKPKRTIPLSMVLTRVSYTLEVETDDNCNLINAINPRDVVTLIRKTAGLHDDEIFNLSNVDQEYIADIGYCGLHSLPVGLYDNRFNLKLWVVPKNVPKDQPELKTTEQPEQQKSPESTQEEPPKYNGDDEPDEECYFDDEDDYDDDGYFDDGEDEFEDEWPEYDADDEDDEFEDEIRKRELT